MNQPEDREAWHSEHYNRADDGMVFKKAIIDALTANPDGMTVPAVRDWLQEQNHFVVVGGYSWLRSFGHEQSQQTVGSLAGRAVRRNENVQDRYSGWPKDSKPDAQVAYALTERLDWWMKRMIEKKQVASIGFNKLLIDTNWQFINGRRRAGIGVYVVGSKPLLVPGQVKREDSKGRTIIRPGLVEYNPLTIDWGEREIVWRKHVEEELGRKSPRTAQMRGLLMEADRIFTKQEDRWGKHADLS